MTASAGRRARKTPGQAALRAWSSARAGRSAARTGAGGTRRAARRPQSRRASRAGAWHGLDGPAEPGRTMLFIHAFMPLGGRTLYYPTPTKSGEGRGSGSRSRSGSPRPCVCAVSAVHAPRPQSEPSPSRARGRPARSTATAIALHRGGVQGGRRRCGALHPNRGARAARQTRARGRSRDRPSARGRRLAADVWRRARLVTGPERGRRSAGGRRGQLAESMQALKASAAVAFHSTPLS